MKRTIATKTRWSETFKIAFGIVRAPRPAPVRTDLTLSPSSNGRPGPRPQPAPSPPTASQATARGAISQNA